MDVAVNDISKSYGDKRAVDGLSFTVEPGRVTGFLGPNGAGKSTTMRVIVGLDTPDSGAVTIGGRHYADLDQPLCQVGALLEARALHPGRSARNHLAYLAATNRIPRHRADLVLEQVGLASVADKPVKAFSLGMGQRLGIAVALLGDPAVLILDEPINGLDVDGVRWVRQLLRDLAAEGRAILLSSHLLGEMSMTADHLVVIRDGRLVVDCSADQFLERSTTRAVRVRSGELDLLSTHLRKAGGEIDQRNRVEAVVTGLSAADIGRIAAQRAVALEELVTVQPSLEETYVELTRSPDLEASTA